MRCFSFLSLLLAASLVSSLKNQQEAGLSSQKQDLRTNIFRRGTRSRSGQSPSGSTSESPPAQRHRSSSQPPPIHSPQQSPQAASDRRAPVDFNGAREHVSLASPRSSFPLLHSPNGARSAKAAGWVFRKSDTSPDDPSLLRSSSPMPHQQPSSPKGQQSPIQEQRASGLAAPASKKAAQRRYSEKKRGTVTANRQLVQDQAKAIQQHQQTISRLRCMGQALCTEQGIDYTAFERHVQEGIAGQSSQARQSGNNIQPHHEMTQRLVNNSLQVHQSHQQQQAQQLEAENRQREWLQQQQNAVRQQFRRRPTPLQRQQLEQQLNQLQQQNRHIELQQMARDNLGLRAALQLPENQQQSPTPPPSPSPPQQPSHPQQLQVQPRPQQILKLQQIQAQSQSVTERLQALLQPAQPHQQAQLQQLQAHIHPQRMLQIQQVRAQVLSLSQQLQAQLQPVQHHQQPQLQRPQAQSQPAQKFSITSTGPPVQNPSVGRGVQQPPTQLQQVQPPTQSLQSGLRRAQFPSDQDIRRDYIRQQSNIDSLIGLAPFDRAARSDSEDSPQGRPTKQPKPGP